MICSSILKTMILSVFYILIAHGTYSFAARTDLIINDCYNLNGEENCGVCGHLADEEPEKCTYPFSYRFEVQDSTSGACSPITSSGSCKLITAHCAHGICQNGGTCHEGYGTFRCKCQGTHYGMKCEHEREHGKKYTGGVQVFINHQVKLRTRTFLVISTDIGGSDLLFKMEAGLFHMKYVSTPKHIPEPKERENYCIVKTGLRQSECAFIRSASEYVYTIGFSYPTQGVAFCIYRGNKTIISSTTPGEPTEFVDDKNRIGYMDEVTITAFQTKTPTLEKLPYVDSDYKAIIFNKAYTLFIYHDNEPYENMPLIGTFNGPSGTHCTRSPRKRPVYSPSTNIQFGFGYGYDRGTNNSYWEKPNEERVTVRHETAEIELVVWQQTQDYKKNVLVKHLYNLKTLGWFGMDSYEFETGIFSYTLYITTDKKLNFETCFLEIRRDQLVPKINLGVNQTIVVNTGDGVVIDARKSTNLNRKDRQRFMKWSCKFGISDKPCFTKRMFDDTADYFTFSENVLGINEMYNFTLKLYEEKYELTTAYAYIALDVRNDSIIVRLSCPKCWNGAIANPIDYNVLVLTHVGVKVDPNAYEYSWVYREVGETEFRPVDDLRVDVNETDKTVFKIGKNKLKYGKSYEFKVSIEKLPKAYGTIAIKTPKKHIKSCDVKPTEGIKAVTLFDISCVVTPADGVNYVYEFFDKYSYDESLYSGRMMGTSINGELYKFRLTRGIVYVVSYDSYRVNEVFNVTVRLHAFDKPYSYVDQLVDFINPATAFEATEIFDLRNSQRDISLTSVIAEILTTGMRRDYVIKDLILPLHESDMYYIANVKLCISSIRNILVAVHKNLRDFELKADVAKRCADVISKATTVLFNRINHIDDEKTLTETICYQIARYILDSVILVVSYKNREVLENIEEFVNPVVLDLVQQTCIQLVQSLDQLSHILLKLQIPGNAPLALNSLENKITSWVKVTYPEVMHKITLSKETSFPLRISKELAETMVKDSYVGVQFVLVNVNPFWWAGGDIVTRVLFVTFCHKKGLSDYKGIHILRYPIQLYYDISRAVREIPATNGYTIDYSDSFNTLEKDLSLSVYRFVPPARAKLFIKFLFNNNQEEIRFLVYFKKHARPDSDDMSKAGVLISKQNPVYNISYEKKNRADIIYYMGILPVVADGNYDRSSKSPFKLNIYYAQCNTWLKWQWTDHGCWVGEGTDDTTLECECTHLSLFAGTVATPPNDSFDFSDLNLLLTPQVSYLSLVILLIVLIMYVAFLLWSVLRDKKDCNKTEVIMLDDNYPGDRCGYLIAVYTGARLKSGTNANVGIKLLGTRADSRAHVLKSASRQTLLGNSDDWFIIYCPHHLGHLTCLHVWHDNFGKGPDWFLDKVKVFDLKRKVEYIFYVYEWVAFDVDSLPEALIAPVTTKDILNEKRKFVENMAVGLRCSHYWTSVLWRHPRDPVTRVHRLHVVMCFIMTAMAGSLLLYLARYTFPSDEDEPTYKLTSFDIFALLMSFTLATTVACSVMYLFTSSLSCKYDGISNSVFIREDHTKRFDEDVIFGNRKKSSKKLHHIVSAKNSTDDFIEYRDITKSKHNKPSNESNAAFYRFLQGSYLAPVHLGNFKSEPLTHKNKIRLALSWLLCSVAIVICCGIVLIFGFRIEPVHGIQWVTTFILILIFDIFIFSMFKILTVSAVLGFHFNRMIPIEKYILLNINDHEKNKHNADKMKHILEMREQDMYLPLTHKKKDSFLKQLNRKARWEAIVQFTAILMFLVVLTMTMTIFTSSLYPSNSHAKHLISSGHLTSHLHFEQVFNRTDMEDFVQYNFISQLYRFMWYNLVPLVDIESMPDRLDWTDDCVSRLVGNAYLRQLRVVAGACPRVRLVENVSSSCSPPWSESLQDKDSYYVGWTSSHAGDPLAEITAWTYSPPDVATSSQCYGASATLYPAGGYFGHLGYMKRETRHAVSTLIQDSWLDRSTRALFVQLTLYNVNTNLFSHITLVAEQTPAGEFLPLAKVETMPIDFTYSVWNIGFVVFLALFTARIILIINKYGLINALSRYINLFDFGLICLGYCTIFVYFVHIHVSSEYVKEYQRKGIGEFFSFTTISKYAFISRWMMCILFFLLVVRLMCSFRFSRIFLRFFYTFYLSFRVVFLLLSCLIIFTFISWRIIGYLLNVFVFNHHTIMILLPRDFNASDKLSAIPLSSKLVILALMYSLSAITIILFTALFTHYYKFAQAFKVVDVDTFSFYNFFKDEIKLIRSKV